MIEEGFRSVENWLGRLKPVSARADRYHFMRFLGWMRELDGDGQPRGGEFAGFALISCVITWLTGRGETDSGFSTWFSGTFRVSWVARATR